MNQVIVDSFYESLDWISRAIRPKVCIIKETLDSLEDKYTIPNDLFLTFFKKYLQSKDKSNINILNKDLIISKYSSVFFIDITCFELFNFIFDKQKTPQFLNEYLNDFNIFFKIDFSDNFELDLIKNQINGSAFLLKIKERINDAFIDLIVEKKLHSLFLNAATKISPHNENAYLKKIKKDLITINSIFCFDIEKTEANFNQVKNSVSLPYLLQNMCFYISDYFNNNPHNISSTELKLNLINKFYEYIKNPFKSDLIECMLKVYILFCKNGAVYSLKI